MSSPRHRLPRTTRPDRRRAGGGWLSLFAMWMIFIGPLVSQSMPMDHHGGGMAMQMDMQMPAVHRHADTHHGQTQDGQLHVMWEKCGYCSLLFNCPALPQALSPLSLAAALPPTRLQPATRHGHARQPLLPRRPQPRAAFLDQRVTPVTYPRPDRFASFHD